MFEFSRREFPVIKIFQVFLVFSFNSIKVVYSKATLQSYRVSKILLFIVTLSEICFLAFLSLCLKKNPGLSIPFFNPIISFLAVLTSISLYTTSFLNSWSFVILVRSYNLLISLINSNQIFLSPEFSVPAIQTSFFQSSIDFRSSGIILSIPE